MMTKYLNPFIQSPFKLLTESLWKRNDKVTGNHVEDLSWLIRKGDTKSVTLGISVEKVCILGRYRQSK